MTTRKRAPKPPTALPDDPVTRYAAQVVEGSIMAGPHVRGACKRHLRDLAAGSKRGLWFDPEAVERVISFHREVLRLNGGEHEGQPFELLPWQVFINGSLFGWKGADGFRRFRMSYVETAKGSGKSPLSAGIGLYCLGADNEPRAEVYAAASKRDQALILFRDAVAMVRQSPALMQRFDFSGGVGREYNIAFPAKGAFFRAIASDDGQSGPRPACALLDEVHEHPNQNMVEMLRAGTKGRRQALIFMITNSGHDKTGVCWKYHEYARKICEDSLQDDSFFAYVCALDEGDDPFKSEACWPKANPSLGQTFQPKYLREQVTAALGMPSKEAVVRRLNFCQWTDAESPWIDRDLWDAAETDFEPANLAGLPCYLGLDLSQKRDLTALSAVWDHGDGSLSLASWFWTPGDPLDEAARRDSVPYPAWRDAGHLFAPAGRIIDKEHVALFVQQMTRTQNVIALAYDNAQMEDFLAACDEIGLDAWIDTGKPDAAGAGLRLVRHGQGFAGYQSDSVLWMPRSVNEIEDRIVKGRLRIRKNPVLRWNSASAVLQTDPQGNRKWDKRKSTGRIDGMVSSTMAVGVATIQIAAPPVSIWDRPEMWSAVEGVPGPDPAPAPAPRRPSAPVSIWDMPGW